MLAVIKTGGKQYLVKEGDLLNIEKIDNPEKKEIVLKEVMLLTDEKEKVKVGNPTIKGATVTASVITPVLKGKKVRIIKFKSKKRYKRTAGHRQKLTRVKISKISS